MKFLEFVKKLNEEDKKSYFLVLIKEENKTTKKINNVSLINRLFTDVKIAENEIKNYKNQDLKSKSKIKSTNDNKIIKNYEIKQVNKDMTEKDFLSFTNNDSNKAKELYNKIKPILSQIK